MSVYRDVILRRAGQQRLLLDVGLELTYRCNLDCFYCYNDRDRPGKPLSLEQYHILLSDLARMQTMFLMLTGGEPMIHSHFFEIGRMARDLGFVVRVRTNGHNLFRRAVERLRDEVQPYMVEVSLHGATADVHDRQTRVPGSFNRLVANIGIVKEVGLCCSVVTTPTAWNEHQIEDMFSLCDTLDVPLRFQGPVAPRENGDPAPLVIQPARETWDRITALQELRRGTPETGNGVGESGRTPEEAAAEETATCSVGVAGVDIDPYGNVQACMHLQERAGNLHQRSIDEIWNHSPLFQRARNRSIVSARQFTGQPPEQLGAPLFCLGVEETLNKSDCGQCRGTCD